jgi:SWI/SNF-related matrix-associated actin-dependent regulator 1 of chromatin subfamily A
VFVKAGIRISLITGETPSDKRQTEVDRFQAGATDCVLASIQAAGVGLTMTRASRAVILEPDWTPAVNDQAECRLHRIGQKDSVLVEYVAVAESVDVRILKALLRKSSIISEVFHP